MPFNIQLDFEFFWSIADDGSLKLEVSPKNQPAKAISSFTFDRDTLMQGLGEDIRMKYARPHRDLSEWTDLIRFLRSTANELEKTLEDSFS